MNVNCNPVTKKSATSNNVITLTPEVDVACNPNTDVFTATVGVGVNWTIGSLDGTEKVTVDVLDNGANVIGTSGQYTLRGNNPKTSAITFTAPAGGFVYIRVTLVWNASTTLIATSDYANIAAPIVNVAFSNVGTSTTSVGVSSNYVCDGWQYRVGTSGAWRDLSTATGTSAAGTITGLTVSATQTIQVRARRADIQRWAAATSFSVTTIGKAIIHGVSSVAVDENAPSVAIDCTVYDTSYTYELTVYYDETPFIMDMPLTFATTGRQTKTIDLTASKSDILGEMPAVTSLMITYVLNTIIGSSVYQDIADGEVYVTEANSSPYWYGTPDVFISDVETADFFGGDQEVTNGFINGVTTIGANTGVFQPQGARAKNGASIDHYFLSVGGVVETSNSDLFTTATNKNISGNTVEIVYGAVDTRGFEVSVSYTVPVYAYTPMYWSKTTIARHNNYDSQIDFTVEAAYSPLSVTVGGTTYTNTPSTSLALRYSTDNGSTWQTMTLTGRNDTTNNVIKYSGTPLDIVNTANVLIELTANDSLLSATLSLTVPNGVPLISFADGKITINGDVEINGDLVVNGTITQNTPSSDLTGTTWQIKNSYTELDCPWTTVTYNINFTSNGNNYTSLKFDNYTIYYNTTSVFTPLSGPPSWTNQAYRTIAITGGADTGSTELREWLEAYATQIV